MSKNLPKLDPGWEYLYKVKYHTYVELPGGQVVYVGPVEGTRVFCHRDKEGWFFISAFTAVKLLPDNNNNKEKKKNALPKLSSNSKS